MTNLGKQNETLLQFLVQLWWILLWSGFQYSEAETPLSRDKTQYVINQ